MERIISMKFTVQLFQFCSQRVKDVDSSVNFTAVIGCCQNKIKKIKKKQNKRKTEN